MPRLNPLIHFPRGLALPRLPIVVHSRVWFQDVFFSLSAWDSGTNPCPPPRPPPPQEPPAPPAPSECLAEREAAAVGLVGAAPLSVHLPASVSVLSVAAERMRARLPSEALPAPRCSAPWILPPPPGGPPPRTQVPRLGHHTEGQDTTAALTLALPLPGPTWVQGGDSAGLRRLLPVLGVKLSPAAARNEHPPGLLGVHPSSRVAPERRLAVPTGHTWPPGPSDTTSSVAVADVCLGVSPAGRGGGQPPAAPRPPPAGSQAYSTY